jgi:hypothetical protein
MKALIGYGSDVSARVLHDLPAMRSPLGRIVGISDFYYRGPKRPGKHARCREASNPARIGPYLNASVGK